MIKNVIIGLTQQTDKVVFDDFHTHCVLTVGEALI